MKVKVDNRLIVTKNKVFSDIFQRDFVKLCYYANNFITDLDVCKDIVQDVFIKLWELGFEEASESDLHKILYRSVRNKSLDYLKNQKVRNNYRIDILQGVVDYQSYNFSDYDIHELSKKIDSELKSLPEQTFKIFDMSRSAGKSYSEIAEILGVSVKSVEFHISKALRSLRIGLKEYLPFISAGLINMFRLF